MERTVLLFRTRKDEETHNANELFDNLTEARELYKTRFEVEKANIKGDPLYVCSYCMSPLGVRGMKIPTEGYFFAHPPNDKIDCPQKMTRNIGIDEINRVKYNGVKEGKDHKRLKQSIYEVLEVTKDIEELQLEKRVTHNGNWRQPDIQANYKEYKIAFELQLSTTFLTVIVERTCFYNENKRFLLWIFDSFSENHDEQAFMQRDIFYNNNNNVYVYDAVAESLSKSEGELWLHCHYIVYSLVDWKIQQEWKSEYITLDKIQFNPQTMDLWYYDSEGQLDQLKNEIIAKEIYDAEELERRNREIQEYEAEQIRNRQAILADEKVSKHVELIRKWHINKTYVFGEIPFFLSYNALETEILNKKLNSKGNFSEFYVKLAQSSDQYALLQFLTKQPAVHVDFSSVQFSVLDFLMRIFTDDDFYRSSCNMFSKGYLITDDEKEQLIRELENCSGNTDLEKKTLNRNTWLLMLDMATSRFSDQMISNKQFMFAIASLKAGHVLGSKEQNLKAVISRLLNSYKDYASFIIRAINVYNPVPEYISQIEIQRKLGEFEKLQDSYSIPFGLITSVFPELRVNKY